jgi:hypothetical protein
MLCRILIVYAVLVLCRVIFYLYNYDSIGPLEGGELWQVVRGSIRFDTISAVYANLPFIVLSLIPLRVRARKWWRTMTFAVYMLANTIAVVAVNLSDAV